MIYDILEVFRKEYEAKGDKLILDNYMLKDGLYVKISDDKSLEYFIFVNDKKVEKKENCFKDLDGNINHKMYEWFKERDYYSSVLDNAKVFDAPKKIIHNNNYLTLFMKIEKFVDVDFIHIKNKLFKKVLSYSDFNSKNEKNILKVYCPKIKSLSRKKEILTKYKILENNFEELRIYVQDYSPKIYLKVFFDENIVNYKEESEIYFALKIFNDNKYSVNDENLVYGLSNSNMGLNSKKPYLENKTRKLRIPFMLTNENARLNKIFFDWLYLQGYKNQYPLQENLFITKYPDNGQAVINDFDYIPIKMKEFTPPLQVDNHLKIDKLEDYELKELFHLESKIDELFYAKQLIFNYFNDDIKVSKFVTKELQNLLFVTKFSMINYFKKYDDREFYQVVKKYGSRFILNSLRAGYELKAKESLNLKLSLLKYKGEKIMNIEEMFLNIKNKLDNSEYGSLNKEEFFFLSGQLANYLLAQKEQHQKKQDLLEPYLRCNNTLKLKKELQFSFFQYKHALFFSNKRFNSAMALIQAYGEKERMSDNMDSFLVGYLADNLFFEKKEK